MRLDKEPHLLVILVVVVLCVDDDLFIWLKTSGRRQYVEDKLVLVFAANPITAWFRFRFARSPAGKVFCKCVKGRHVDWVLLG